MALLRMALPSGPAGITIETYKNWRQVMNFDALSTTPWALIIALVVIVAAGIVTLLSLRKRRTSRLRAQFGGPEYSGGVRQGRNQRSADNKVQASRQRV